MPKKEPDNIFSYLHNHVQVLNGSKIFAGIMIILLKIATFIGFYLLIMMNYYY